MWKLDNPFKTKLGGAEIFLNFLYYWIDLCVCIYIYFFLIEYLWTIFSHGVHILPSLLFQCTRHFKIFSWHIEICTIAKI